MAGHPAALDLFDSLDALAWVVASIRNHPVLPPHEAAPARPPFMQLAEIFSAQVNIRGDKDFARMLNAGEPNELYKLRLNNHIANEAYTHVIEYVQEQRNKQHYRESNEYLYLNPMFVHLFQKAKNLVFDRLDDSHPFKEWLTTVAAATKPTNEYEEMTNQIALRKLDIEDLVNTIEDMVDVRGNLVPIEMSAIPTVQTMFGRTQMLNPDAVNARVVHDVLTEALEMTLKPSPKPTTGTAGGKGDLHEYQGVVGRLITRGRQDFVRDVMNGLTVRVDNANDLIRYDEDIQYPLKQYEETLQREAKRLPWWRRLLGDSPLGGETYTVVSNFVEKKTRQADFMAVLLLGGLNPRIFNMVYAPPQKLTTEEFFNHVHRKLRTIDGNIVNYIFVKQPEIVQDMTEPRITINPQATSFVEETMKLEDALDEYINECHHRGRNLYIIILAFFLQRDEAKEDYDDLRRQKAAFVDMMAALYTQQTFNNSRSMTGDYLPSTLQKRQKMSHVQGLEKQILLERLLGLDESWPRSGFTQLAF
jgi:hypothetical protein